VCSWLADPLLVFADCGVAIRETYNTLERFAQPYAKARQYDVPGFFYLESRFRLNPGEQPAIYTAFELCLHECRFDRRY
jgi:hypothetical protein